LTNIQRLNSCPGQALSSGYPGPACCSLWEPGRVWWVGGEFWYDRGEKWVIHFMLRISRPGFPGRWMMSSDCVKWLFR